MFVSFKDPAKILSVTSSAAKSWIGQTVTLTCVSDGVPTPTLIWYEPDGNELNTVTAKENTVKVTINDDQCFGEFKCVAYNGLDPLNNASMSLQQISMCKGFNKIYRMIVMWLLIDDLDKKEIVSAIEV